MSIATANSLSLHQPSFLPVSLVPVPSHHIHTTHTTPTTTAATPTSISAPTPGLDPAFFFPLAVLPFALPDAAGATVPLWPTVGNAALPSTSHPPAVDVGHAIGESLLAEAV